MHGATPALDDSYRGLASDAVGKPVAGYLLKRPLDILFAVWGLALVSPLLVLTAFAVLISMGRQVLFRQQRAGLGGKVFQLYKFRTMKTGPAPDEQRLTRLGRFLRASGIDELPQFWNIIRGEMSLVGPRPLLAEYLPFYNRRQMLRHRVRPGITGWAQVRGRDSLSWPEKFELDLWYVDHCSLALDLRILLLTIGQIIRRVGVSQPGHATAARFDSCAEGSPGVEHRKSHA